MYFILFVFVLYVVVVFHYPQNVLCRCQQVSHYRVPFIIFVPFPFLVYETKIECKALGRRSYNSTLALMTSSWRGCRGQKDGFICETKGKIYLALFIQRDRKNIEITQGVGKMVSLLIWLVVSSSPRGATNCLSINLR